MGSNPTLSAIEFDAPRTGGFEPTTRARPQAGGNPTLSAIEFDAPRTGGFEPTTRARPQAGGDPTLSAMNRPYEWAS